jgi:hypothetical protein
LVSLENSPDLFHPLPDLKVGDFVYYRGLLSRVESLEFEGRHCWVVNTDGDTYLVAQSHPELQDAVLRVTAAMDRCDFDL